MRSGSTIASMRSLAHRVKSRINVGNLTAPQSRELIVAMKTGILRRIWGWNVGAVFAVNAVLGAGSAFADLPIRIDIPSVKCPPDISAAKVCVGGDNSR